MDVCPSLPIQCVTLDPLYNTPARLRIGDILKLKPILGSRSIFVFNTHPINSVHVLGLVTSLKRKEDSWAINLDDGTGSIQCYCPIKSIASPELANFKSLSLSLQKRCRGLTQIKSMDLGDFLNVIGPVKVSSLSNKNYISHCSWSVLNFRNMDEIWLNSLKEQEKLYQEVYSKPFVISEQLIKSSKSFLEKKVREVITKHLESIIGNLINDSADSPMFLGYEILEMDEVNNLLRQCFVNSATEGNSELMSDREKKSVMFKAIAGVLHANVSNGILIRKKGLKYEAMTNMDQLDAQYYVTAYFKPFLKAVQNAVEKLDKENKAVHADAVLQVFDCPDFNFLRVSKHGFVAVLNALELLSKDTKR